MLPILSARLAELGYQDEALAWANASDDPTARAQALAKIVPNDPKLVPLLVDCLKSKDHKRLRFSAAQALGRLGPGAKEAVPALIETLKAVDVGDQMLDEGIKFACTWALGQIGPEAKEAIPVLQDLSAHYDPTVRAEAKKSLEKIRPAK